MRMKTKRTTFSLALLAGLCLLTACEDRRLGQATPQAAAEYAVMTELFQALREEEWMEKELNDLNEVAQLIAHFDRTADARYATPKHGLSMLHLACLFKKNELARCLLLDGADPNLSTRDEYLPAVDTPLRFAISPGITEEDTDDKLIALVDLLVRNGAKTDAAIYNGESLLTTAAYVCESERVARHLLNYIPQVNARELCLIIDRGWVDMLREILDKQQIPQEQLNQTIIASARPFHTKDGYTNKRCTELLLSKGADINYFDTEDPFNTTLITAVDFLKVVYEEEQALADEWLDYIAFLIMQGADTNVISTSAGLSAHDMLASRPEWLQELEKRGVQLKGEDLRLEPGEQLLDNIIRAWVRKMSAEQVAPYFDTIASIFTPTAAQLKDAHRLESALLTAAELMAKVDVQRAQEVINNSSIWRINLSAPSQETDDEFSCPVTAASLIYTLQEIPVLAAKKEHLLAVADKALIYSDTHLAAGAVELLGRCPDAEADVQRLLESSQAAVRAGAWGALLQIHHLPAATNGGVSKWLKKHGREANSPEMQTALLATSLEEMWYNKMTPERKQEFLQALQTIGAPPEAISVYGEFADNMNNPEKLDELEQLGKNWQYELEISTAKYILLHKEHFLPHEPTK